ncbi:integrase [Aeromonas jandaei]|uniref:integrase n=1 Tax=Aeromonas jandaei TaxID=650 RepID=UPI003BA15FE4
MHEIVLFTPKAALDATANLHGFIEMCRDKLTVFGSDLPFQQDVWDVTDAVKTNGHGSKRVRITFSNTATVSEKNLVNQVMMQEPFLSFSKAYIRYMHGMRPTKNIHNRVAALRALETALSENGTAPNPVQVDSRILNRAAQLIVEGFSDGAAYRVGGQLELINTFMSENRLTTVRTSWHNSIKRPSSAMRVGKEFDERRADKMPSLAALDALPKIFHLATKPADVIPVSVAAILLSAPDRISEVLMLPAECEVRENLKGKDPAYGLRWWPAKGAEPMVKWLIPSMTSTVKQALINIRSVTDEARRIAKWYELNPSQIYLAPEVIYLRGQEWLSITEVGKILGLSSASASNWCNNNAIPKTRYDGKKGGFARFSDVEAVVVDQLPPGFPYLDPATGLKYSEALLVVLQNQLDTRRGTFKCMIESVTIGQINTGLGSRVEHGHESVFSRLKFTEEDGSPISMTSHQFRHLLNTIGQAGGLSQLDLSKWSGRVDIRQNEAYDHLSAGQMLEKIREAVGGNDMFGPLAELPQKALIRRDEFARLVIPTAHTTEIGYCVHDYTSSPCQVHMDCIHCQDLVCIKGDTEKTKRLHQQLEEAKDFVAKAKTAVEQEYAGSNRWLEHHLSTIERLSQLCTIMDDPSVPHGAVIQLAAPQMATHTQQPAVKRIDLAEDEQARIQANVRALMRNMS